MTDNDSRLGRSETLFWLDNILICAFYFYETGRRRSETKIEWAQIALLCDILCKIYLTMIPMMMIFFYQKTDSIKWNTRMKKEHFQPIQLIRLTRDKGVIDGAGIVFDFTRIDSWDVLVIHPQDDVERKTSQIFIFCHMFGSFVLRRAIDSRSKSVVIFLLGSNKKRKVERGRIFDLAFLITIIRWNPMRSKRNCFTNFTFKSPPLRCLEFRWYFFCRSCYFLLEMEIEVGRNLSISNLSFRWTQRERRELIRA